MQNDTRCSILRSNIRDLNNSHFYAKTGYRGNTNHKKKKKKEMKRLLSIATSVATLSSFTYTMATVLVL